MEEINFVKISFGDTYILTTSRTSGDVFDKICEFLEDFDCCEPKSCIPAYVKHNKDMLYLQPTDYVQLTETEFVELYNKKEHKNTYIRLCSKCNRTYNHWSNTCVLCYYKDGYKN